MTKNCSIVGCGEKHRAKGLCINHYNSEHKFNLKLDILAAYGFRCYCCGEYRPQFLTIGHSLNDGAAHRAEFSGSGSGKNFYGAMKKLGYPQNLGLRVECWNCNCGANSNGGVCPHGTFYMSTD